VNITAGDWHMVSDVSQAHEAFITDALTRGLFKDRKELLQSAIDLLRRKQEILDEVRMGVRELETGDCLELDDAGLDALGRQIASEGRQELKRESSAS
jgi:Arc/MetJ-type ribon-helix-helix transcriptional regulator